jgi:hypothetical protein
MKFDAWGVPVLTSGFRGEASSIFVPYDENMDVVIPPEQERRTSRNPPLRYDAGI